MDWDKKFSYWSIRLLPSDDAVENTRLSVLPAVHATISDVPRLPSVPPTTHHPPPPPPCHLFFLPSMYARSALTTKANGADVIVHHHRKAPICLFTCVHARPIHVMKGNPRSCFLSLSGRSTNVPSSTRYSRKARRLGISCRLCCSVAAYSS